MSDEIVKRPPDIKPRSKLWQRTFTSAILAGDDHNEAKRQADQAEREREAEDESGV